MQTKLNFFEDFLQWKADFVQFDVELDYTGRWGFSDIFPSPSSGRNSKSFHKLHDLQNCLNISCSLFEEVQSRLRLRFCTRLFPLYFDIGHTETQLYTVTDTYVANVLEWAVSRTKVNLWDYTRYTLFLAPTSSLHFMHWEKTTEMSYFKHLKVSNLYYIDNSLHLYLCKENNFLLMYLYNGNSVK